MRLSAKIFLKKYLFKLKLKLGYTCFSKCEKIIDCYYFHCTYISVKKQIMKMHIGYSVCYAQKNKNTIIAQKNKNTIVAYKNKENNPNIDS